MMTVFHSLLIVLYLISGAAPQSLPTVDLGYEIHRANFYDSTEDYYNFSNIRYAEAPVGNLRFAAPVSPSANSSTIDDGTVGRICPQAVPGWYRLYLAEVLPDYLTGRPFNYSAAVEDEQSFDPSSTLASVDPRTTEDCLFLDIVVPKKVFEGAGVTPVGAPVLVWIYGGGWSSGDKSGINDGNPFGLIKASQASGSDGIIYVSFNYRLGPWGWLSGPTFQNSGGLANAGLYDQHLALQWVQDNIHLFGGDPSRVTLIGESAGAGSVLPQIIAFNGRNGPSPFQQAILQSATLFPSSSTAEQESLYQDFLQIANVSTLEELKQLPSETLILANLQQMYSAPWGIFPYRITVDGSFLTAHPARVLRQGSFDKNITIITGYNANEGFFFTPPYIQNDTAYSDLVGRLLPDASPDIKSYIINTLYPPIFDGTYGYTDQFGRATTTLGDLLVVCNSVYLAQALNNKTYNYLFGVFPGVHMQDIPYTFYDGAVGPDNLLGLGVANDTLAIAMQEYLTSFVETGIPMVPGLPEFPQYGSEKSLLSMNLTTVSTAAQDPLLESRCMFWQNRS